MLYELSQNLGCVRGILAQKSELTSADHALEVSVCQAAALARNVDSVVDVRRRESAPAQKRAKARGARGRYTQTARLGRPEAQRGRVLTWRQDIQVALCLHVRDQQERRTQGAHDHHGVLHTARTRHRFCRPV